MSKTSKVGKVDVESAAVEDLEQALCRLEQLGQVSAVAVASGHNRQQVGVCQIQAQDDVAAVQQFLAEYENSPATHRTYRKEVERLVLWAAIERKKPLSDLNREDFAAYQTFLADPQPASRWCGPKRGRRGKVFSPGWRPFVGPLGPSARKSALVIINSMLTYLVQANYLAGNPLALMRQRNRVDQVLKSSKRAVLQRSFSDRQWHAVVDTLEALPNETNDERAHQERLRFVVALLHFLSLRIGELASHSMGDFVQLRGHWVLCVVGKGSKQGEIPVPPAMLEALERYRTHLGHPPLPQPNDETPLVCDLYGRRRVSARRVNQLLKDFLAQAALRLEAEHPHEAAQLRRGSAHWFRHTSLTRQSQKGIELKHLKANARHSKTDTTMLYVHLDDDERYEEMKKHTWR